MNKRKHQTIYSLLLSVCFGMVNLPTHAQSVVSDVDGSADLSFLSRYRESGIVRYEQTKSSDFLFALARVRKIDNRWQAERERREYGAHTSITYRVPDRITAQSVYKHFRTQIEEAGFAENFECSGRSCGNSNKWANVVYREKRLYGPDVNQHYLVASKDNETLALYVIKRGNKRVYARIDHVVAQAQSSETQTQLSWSEQLQRGGVLILPVGGDGLQKRSADISELAGWLSSSRRTLHVVGHAYGEAGISVLKRQSLNSAVSLRRRLIELGADAALIDAHGLGPLAPGVRSDQDRLELLLID